MGFSRNRLPKADYSFLVFQVMERDGLKCRNCGGRAGETWLPLTVHHIVYRSHGGLDIPANLITICNPCHSAIHGGKLWIIGDADSAQFVTENPRGKIPFFKK